MALAAVKTFIAGEVLLAADLNALNTNILDNALSLVSPWTANMSAGGFLLTTLNLGSAGSPSLQFTGDTNTGVYRPAADTVGLAGAGVDVVRATGAAGGVNYHDLRSQSAGNAPELQAAGTDTNISLRMVPKGTGYVQIATAGGYVDSTIVPGLAFADFDSGMVQVLSGTVSLVAEGRESARFVASPSATNYLFLAASATGATPYLGVAGGDANIDLQLRAKGSGVVSVATAFVATSFMGGGQPLVNALYAQQIPRAWVSVTNTITLEDSFNISSITDETAAGYFTTNFHRTFSGGTYVPLGISQVFTTTGHVVGMGASKNRQADSCTLMTFRTDTFGGSPDASAFVVFFGRQ